MPSVNDSNGSHASLWTGWRGSLSFAPLEKSFVGWIRNAADALFALHTGFCLVDWLS